jgi:hypothetical protein
MSRLSLAARRWQQVGSLPSSLAVQKTILPCNTSERIMTKGGPFRSASNAGLFCHMASLSLDFPDSLHKPMSLTYNGAA